MHHFVKKSIFCDISAIYLSQEQNNKRNLPLNKDAVHSLDHEAYRSYAFEKHGEKEHSDNYDVIIG